MPVALLVALSGAACGTSSAGSSRTLSVVAAENFYGDIAFQIGGARVHVTSILSDPQADPHLFEPGTAVAAEVATATLVIENGLGYDAFVDRLIAAAPNDRRRVVNVSSALGVGSGANPHIWYDLPRAGEIAAAIERGLASVDSAHQSEYRQRLQTFDASLKPLLEALDAIKTRHPGAPVAYTEAVPAYLLQAAGLRILTPEAFARAIEQGTDPPPQAFAAMDSLLTGHLIDVLLYNSQATSPITERLRAVAGQNGIPVVPVTETLPPGATFQTWQLGQIRAIAAALDR